MNGNKIRKDFLENLYFEGNQTHSNYMEENSISKQHETYY
jgi:hypothetical protein